MPGKKRPLYSDDEFWQLCRMKIDRGSERTANTFVTLPKGFVPPKPKPVLGKSRNPDDWDMFQRTVRVDLPPSGAPTFTGRRAAQGCYVKQPRADRRAVHQEQKAVAGRRLSFGHKGSRCGSERSQRLRPNVRKLERTPVKGRIVCHSTHAEIDRTTLL